MEINKCTKPMELNKHNVCVFIENEEQLEEMREFLEGNGEKVDNSFWFCLDENRSINYLQLGLTNLWWLCSPDGFELITIEQFKKLWE